MEIAASSAFGGLLAITLLDGFPGCPWTALRTAMRAVVNGYNLYPFVILQV